MSRKSLPGSDQADGGRGEFAAAGRGLADQFEQLGARLGPHDRFVGRAERREHPRQPLLLLLGPGLFVGAVEIVERERNVFRQPRQQFHQIVGECAFLAGKKQQHADRLAPFCSSGKACAGLRAVFAWQDHASKRCARRRGNRCMMQGCRVRNDVPVRPRPSGRSAEIAKRLALHALVVLALGRGDSQKLAVGLGQRDGRGGERSARARRPRRPVRTIPPASWPA